MSQIVPENSQPDNSRSKKPSAFAAGASGSSKFMAHLLGLEHKQTTRAPSSAKLRLLLLCAFLVVLGCLSFFVHMGPPGRNVSAGKYTKTDLSETKPGQAAVPVSESPAPPAPAIQTGTLPYAAGGQNTSNAGSGLSGPYSNSSHFGAPAAGVMPVGQPLYSPRAGEKTCIEQTNRGFRVKTIIDR